MSEELRPCPFCGSEQSVQGYEELGWCSKCISNDVVNNWQSRPIEDSLRKQLEQLSTNLSVILDCVDYSAGNCKPNEPVGGVLPKVVIDNARLALAKLQGEPSGEQK